MFTYIVMPSYTVKLFIHFLNIFKKKSPKRFKAAMIVLNIYNLPFDFFFSYMQQTITQRNITTAAIIPVVRDHRDSAEEKKKCIINTC